IWECTKGIISNYVLIETAKYRKPEKIEWIIDKSKQYTVYTEIPEDEWEIYDSKKAGYQMIYRGTSFGLRTDNHVTNYNFAKQ
ncbi:MAG: hypothetical protein J6I56_07180, partial [Lachnospiraceae bacterium]|nr:hypothetical protein [Lachnospiraceae bacterium]